MKTVHNNAELKWHLENNVQPPLNKSAVNGVLATVDKFNKGEITLDDNVTKSVNVTVGQMFEDLHIEVE